MSPQNILNTLTDDQLDQLYDWLLELPAKQVREKVAQPAPEGFGLNTHVTTLRRFKARRWAELAADQIEVATHLARTTADQHDALHSGLVASLKHQLFQRVSSPDATDAQLALVGRWVHREEKLQLDIQRVQISRERLVQNDRRLQILDRSVQLRADALAHQREQSARRAAKSSPSPNGTSGITHDDANGRKCDQPGPLANTLDDIRPRARVAFDITPEESARRAELRRKWKLPNLDQPSEMYPHSVNSGPNQSNASNASNPIELVNDVSNHQNATPADPFPKSPCPIGGESQADAGLTVPRVDNLSPSSSASASSALKSDPALSEIHSEIPEASADPATIAACVDAYTVARAREYIAHNQKYTPWPHKHFPPPFTTKNRHCPCGHACPCPTHESEKFGPFPGSFWSFSPFSGDYGNILEERNLPYRLPAEYLA